VLDVDELGIVISLFGEAALEISRARFAFERSVSRGDALHSFAAAGCESVQLSAATTRLTSNSI
jgi:hypothetical protein